VLIALELLNENPTTVPSSSAKEEERRKEKEEKKSMPFQLLLPLLHDSRI